ncbi:N-acetyltransferase [Actinorhabdospora filicis]|uniref:N-acetyltransferase n=1 Tax=Actinorhabdospora filicis TaxID=1785913 RepID=A0A9W6SUH5_9ACTN|nr:GNAT family N-acetyltransferase [Actinorhabdospora filicis]GLZ80981.1 N-acetyltransferase [Actinorhabdospora filicis]
MNGAYGGPMPLSLVPMTPAHAEDVLAVYAAGIATGHATFETATPSWADFDAARLPAHRFVALDGVVAGWIACSRKSARPAYAGVVEHSVYVRPGYGGRGIGGELLRAFIASTEAAGIWTIETAVFPENTASLALHRRFGFREVGVRERIGMLAGRWRDTVLMERRSPVVA